MASLKTHDFFVCYYEDDDLALRFVEYFVKRWETEFRLRGLYFHRDAVIGKSKFAALEDDIGRSRITVVVFTKGFMNSPGGFPKYANAAAFAQLLRSITSTPCYIPIGVGLEEEELPNCIQNVLSVAKFEEYDWDQQVQVWRQLDNVLVENDLLTQQQINQLGSTFRRYIKPAERLMSDKFLRDNVASRICNEYFGLGIGLSIPHHRLEQIRKTDTDPFNYIFKMLITWREDCEGRKMSEDDMLDALSDALSEVERLDVKQIVNFNADKFKEKRQLDQENRRLANAEAEQIYQQQSNGAAVNNRHNSESNNQPQREAHSTLQYVAQEENELTSVMKVHPTTQTLPKLRSGAAQGFVPLHDRRWTRQGSEQQVVLKGDGGYIDGPSLIPMKSVESENENSDGFSLKTVPWWTLPVAMGMSAAVAGAVTAFVCMRYKS